MRDEYTKHITHIGAASERDPTNGNKYRETMNTCTYDEVEKGINKDPRKPAGTYNLLKNNVMTYKNFLLALFGD